jgi:hypothetical protein
MHNILLEIYAKTICANGPDRILINEYEGIPSQRAREQYGIFPDIVFIRHDGWSLGCPHFYEKAGYQLWKNEWIGYIRKPNKIPELIENYE